MRLRKRIGKAGLGQGDLGGFGGFWQIGLDKKPLASYFEVGVNWKYYRPKSSLNEQASQTVFDERLNFSGLARLRLRLQEGPLDIQRRQGADWGFIRGLDTFRSDCGRYPTTAEGLNALVTRPVDTNAMPQWHQYIDGGRIPTDPWGNPYVYVCPGKHNTFSFDLYSCGADGISKSGGDDYDDVNNWDPDSPRDPDRAENLVGLKWSAGLFLLTLATVIGYRQIFKPVGNLHGLIAIGLIFGVAVMGFVAALSGWYWLNSTSVGDGFFLAGYMGVVWLAISGVRRGCQVSKFCGWFVIVTAILLILVMFLAPRFA